MCLFAGHYLGSALRKFRITTGSQRPFPKKENSNMISKCKKTSSLLLFVFAQEPQGLKIGCKMECLTLSRLCEKLGYKSGSWQETNRKQQLTLRIPVNSWTKETLSSPLTLKIRWVERDTQHFLSFPFFVYCGLAVFYFRLHTTQTSQPKTHIAALGQKLFRPHITGWIETQDSYVEFHSIKIQCFFQMKIFFKKKYLNSEL